MPRPEPRAPIPEPRTPIPDPGPPIQAAVEEVVRLVGVEKALGGHPVLRGVSFAVDRGQTYCIIGRSGTGKSVTLKHIVGLLDADRGEVRVFGTNLAHASAKEIAGARKQMGYLFQSGALINWLSVGENVALPLREHERCPEAEIRRRVVEKLGLVGLDGVGQKMPETLSGGMKKRVGLARALVRDPELILYDEPTSGLDPVMASQINELILDMQAKLGVTSVVVTHDMQSAYRVSNRIGMLHEGRIIEEGTPDQIQGTANPVVRQFIEGNVTGPITAE